MGFNSVNDYLLSLLRGQSDTVGGQIDANGNKRQTPVKKSHQNDAPEKMKVKVGDKPAVEAAHPAAKESKNLKTCEHGYIAKLCKHEKCRNK